MVGLGLIWIAAMVQAPAAADQPANEQRDVLAAVERMFEAMRQRDFETYSDVHVPEAMTIRVRTDGSEHDRIRFRSNAKHIELFRDGADRFDERIWNAVVHVHGPIAVVWAPYDFHINGKFSHCGFDLFEMLKVDGKWRLSNASWTVETVGCSPSPLGPLPPRQ